MELRNHSRNDGNLRLEDTVEIVNSEDAQQNGVYTVARITSDEEGECELTLVSQTNPGFVAVVLIAGEPISAPINQTLQ